MDGCNSHILFITFVIIDCYYLLGGGGEGITKLAGRLSLILFRFSIANIAILSTSFALPLNCLNTSDRYLANAFLYFYTWVGIYEFRRIEILSIAAYPNLEIQCFNQSGV